MQALNTIARAGVQAHLYMAAEQGPGCWSWIRPAPTHACSTLSLEHTSLMSTLVPLCCRPDAQPHEGSERVLAGALTMQDPARASNTAT